MPIPVANIYYLLCYAWDEFAPKQMASVAAEHCPDTLHLFARLLAAGVRALHRRGLETGYVQRREAIVGVRGRIAMSDTIRCLASRPRKLVCDFDELDPNVLTNQIIKSTMTGVLGHSGLHRDVRAELREARKLLMAVQDVQLEARLFHQVQLHRNNRIYSFLMNVCRFFYEGLEPQDRAGKHRFQDVARDPERMRRVFEKFVRHFLVRHLGSGFRVKRDEMAWVGSALGTSDLRLMPEMQTDVTVRSAERTVVIECKYTEALYDNRFLAEKFRPAHLYQLSAYLRNLESRSGPDSRAEGILLYPTTGVSLNQSYILHGHRVSVKTLDLDQPWTGIEAQMLALLHGNEVAVRSRAYSQSA